MQAGPSLRIVPMSIGFLLPILQIGEYRMAVDQPKLITSEEGRSFPHMVQFY